MEIIRENLLNEDELVMNPRSSIMSISQMCEEDQSNLSDNEYSEKSIVVKLEPCLIAFPSKNQFKKCDFELTGSIGIGGNAKVVKAKLLRDNSLCAIKIINKSFIMKEKKLYQVYLENEILSSLDHPNIIKILGVFEENDKIYIVLEYCACGDFYDFIMDNAPLPFKTAQYYSAQLVLSLEYLHLNNIMHRDLKPENIMLDDKMRIKIIDFATAKIKGKAFNKNTMKFEDSVEDTNKSFFFMRKNSCMEGTAEYLSPEALNHAETGPETDLWALGCIIYQMFTGRSPFKEKTEFLVFRKIIENKISFPSYIPESAVSLIKGLLISNPSHRLGAGQKGSQNDFSSLKNTKFFQGIKFEEIYKVDLPNKTNLKLSVFFKDSKKECILIQKENKKEETQIMKQGFVNQKSSWFRNNSRQLILYNSGKMEYLNLMKEVKGVILLSSSCKSILKGNNRFNLITPNEKFVYQTENNEAVEWHEVINNIISSFN